MRLSPTLLNDILRYYHNGYSVRQIGSRLGLGKSTVGRVVKRCRVSRDRIDATRLAISTECYVRGLVKRYEEPVSAS